MTVVAIRCEACSDTGLVWSQDGNCWRVLVDCPVCHGSKVESPNPDLDLRARQAIEGTRHEDI